MKHDSKSGNKFELLNRGAVTDYLEFEVVLADGVESGATPDLPMRRNMKVRAGLGIIHLDIKINKTGVSKIGDIIGAPQFVNNVEVQNSGANFWRSTGSIHLTNYEVGKRYIVDLIGFVNIN